MDGRVISAFSVLSELLDESARIDELLSSTVDNERAVKGSINRVDGSRDSMLIEELLKILGKVESTENRLEWV